MHQGFPHPTGPLAEAVQAQDLSGEFGRCGPDTLAGAFLRRFWQPVMLSEGLPLARARAVRIMGEDLTAYRTASGRAQIVQARCPHRSMALSAARVEGEALQCFYHGWTFDAEGQCIAQPAEEGGVGYASKVRIRSYPTREYLGLVFAFLGEGGPPPFPHLDMYDTGGVIDTMASYRECNYFEQIEISVDEVHFNFVHRNSQFADAGLNEEIPRIEGVETGYGIERRAIRGDSVRLSHFFMPNLLVSLVHSKYRGWGELAAWRVPVDDDSHITFTVNLVHAEGEEAHEFCQRRDARREVLRSLPNANEIARAVLRGEISIDSINERPDALVIQDLVAMMGCDAQRDRKRDSLGRSDRQLVLLRSIWKRELQALRDGTPLKSWTCPSGLQLSTGL
ncbi:MAG: Rieske 2Fe-2S domain-containing protein [Burkholderiaceae bacterium]